MNEPRSARQLLAEARRTIKRFTPPEALSAQQAGAVLVDLRCDSDRNSEGSIPGAIAIPLSVLPWRADPNSGSEDPRITDRDAVTILVCNDGYSSSLAAATLVRMGFRRAGDIDGGYRAWAASGLPVDTTP